MAVAACLKQEVQVATHSRCEVVMAGHFGVSSTGRACVSIGTAGSRRPKRLHRADSSGAAMMVATGHCAGESIRDVVRAPKYREQLLKDTQRQRAPAMPTASPLPPVRLTPPRRTAATAEFQWG